MSIIIHAVSPKVEYHIKLNSKMTVITGHSGEGKTVFYNALADNSLTSFKVNVEKDGHIVNDYIPRAIPQDESTYMKGISSLPNHNILVFDDTDYVLTNEFAKIFAEDKNNLYLVINRFNTSRKGLVLFNQASVSMCTLVTDESGRYHKLVF